MSHYSIRLAQKEDLPTIIDLIQQGRSLLKEQGSTQWQDGHPTEERLAEDICQKASYLLLVDGKIAGTAALLKGPDTSYEKIYDGSWFDNEAPYASIHRLTISPNYRGKKLSSVFLKELIQLAKKDNIPYMRIDTHILNKGMQKSIHSVGFCFRGIIYVSVNPDGHRLAYELPLL